MCVFCRLINVPCSTAIQRQIYTEDFDEIIGQLPFLKNRLESDDPSKVIRKIMNHVRAHCFPEHTWYHSHL